VNHKPKLIAVTGYNVGAGTSTLAAGLASTLSETGDGKVLLVDMNGTNGEAYPFFDGTPAVSLTKALRLTANGSSHAPAAGSRENLFLARADAPASGVSSAGLRRIMPELKASDFDYIIFDMPPLGQTRPTATLAGHMDKVLVVVESQVTPRSEVQRGYRDLTDAGAEVSMIFNKAQFYGPRALVGAI
jgi:Mrp family chromosome partitioning ATPase